MTIKDVRHLLIECKVPVDAYWLTKGLPNEAYCLNNTGTLWEYYYSERGQRSGYKSFADENDACHYFLDRLSYPFAGLKGKY